MREKENVILFFKSMLYASSISVFVYCVCVCVCVCVHTIAHTSTNKHPSNCPPSLDASCDAVLPLRF